jgi:hypothetical protein
VCLVDNLINPRLRNYLPRPELWPARIGTHDRIRVAKEKRVLTVSLAGCPPRRAQIPENRDLPKYAARLAAACTALFGHIFGSERRFRLPSESPLFSVHHGDRLHTDLTRPLPPLANKDNRIDQNRYSVLCCFSSSHLSRMHPAVACLQIILKPSPHRFPEQDNPDHFEHGMLFQVLELLTQAIA